MYSQNEKPQVIVIFNGEPPQNLSHYDEVISGEKLKSLIDPGSIYEATDLLEQLPKLKFDNNINITQSLMYEGYELWWIHNNDLFRYFCLPYTQYRRLLEYLKEFKMVHLYNPPFESLFDCYLKANNCSVKITSSKKSRIFPALPFGVLIQIVLTLIYLPVIVIRRFPILVYTGDKFEKGKDFDFRMRFVYDELRRKNMKFVEYIRGIEPWKAVLMNAWKRKRPVIYAEAVVFISRFVSSWSRRKSYNTGIKKTPEERFKLAIATQYVCTQEDVWATRIMRLLVRVSDIKVAFIPAASERSWHTVLGCKLNNVPTVGIMHGVQSRYYNTYDFLTGFNGSKSMVVDKFGVWSEWWKSYYEKNSDSYTSGNLYVSGLMRPLEKKEDLRESVDFSSGYIKVLFVSEEMAVPQEVLPYLYELLKHKDIKVFIKFRPYRDGFEVWLNRHDPDILKRKDLEIYRGSMQEAIENIDIAVGCQSTGVIEALLQFKIPIYFKTKKWGDYYNIYDYDKSHSFFAGNPEELVKKIKTARSSISNVQLEELQERYFGDPYKNGSKWVVDEIEKVIS